jgi:hypothetical protein
MKPGDIIGFSGDSLVSIGINLGTWGLPFWGISHVGILAEFDGNLLLFESTTLCDLPCEIKGRKFKGSQAHNLLTRLRGYQGKAWHYPLYRGLYEDERKRLNGYLKDTIGTPYSEIGAFRAAGFGTLETLFGEESQSAGFCSEWVESALSEIGVFPTDDAYKWNPNRLTRTLRRSGLLKAPQRIK